MSRSLAVASVLAALAAMTGESQDAGAVELPTGPAVAGVDAPVAQSAAHGADEPFAELHMPVVLRGPPPWAQLTIEPPVRQIEIGDTTTLAVRLSSGVELRYLSFNVRFDPRVLQVVDKRPGDGTQMSLGDFPHAVGMTQYSLASNDQGYVRYFLWTEGDIGSSGEGTLLWIDMLVVSEGVTELTFEWTEARQVSSDVDVTVGTTGASVKAVPATPAEVVDCPSTRSRYGSLTVVGDRTDRPAAEHPDLNLAVRGYYPSPAYRGLVDYNGAFDERAPQLSGLVPGLVGDDRPEIFIGTDTVNDWDWASGHRGGPIDDWPVTMAELDASPGTLVVVPHSGYTIGEGKAVLVLYADPERLTLKFTREDNVVKGYTLHLENLCVDPDLLDSYKRHDRDGRSSLPALSTGQAVGTARQGGLRFAIRDTGQFMDPRARKDWWHGW